MRAQTLPAIHGGESIDGSSLMAIHGPLVAGDARKGCPHAPSRGALVVPVGVVDYVAVIEPRMPATIPLRRGGNGDIPGRVAAVEIPELSPLVAMMFAGLAGLVVGSFLNVVAHRLPIMMERAWRQQCADLARQPPAALPAAEIAFNLWMPRSACPDCGAAIAVRHNIPLLSYAILRGRCTQCGAGISPRYPVVEAVGGGLSLVIVWVLGPTWQAAAALPFAWTLLVLSVIDLERQQLPDALTLPLLWGGLLLSLVRVDGGVLFTDVGSSVIGAAGGYLILWTVYHAFKLITGKEGMGYGDFKLLAALGAWLGWQSLPLIVLLSAATGAIVGIAGVMLLGRSRHVPIPFGPFLAAAGLVTLLWGEALMGRYVQWFL